jgi:hypothetical protein
MGGIISKKSLYYITEYILSNLLLKSANIREILVKLI